MNIEMNIARETSHSTPEIPSDSRSSVPSSPVARPKVLSKSDHTVDREEPARSAEMLNEVGLRNYVSGLAKSGQIVRATLLIAPTASPEVSTSLPELFWKLVERRIHAATFTYMSEGKLREDTVRVTPHGYSLQRS